VSQTDLTVMIPAYREAEALRALLPKIVAAAAALTPAYEVLIIDTRERMDDTDDVCAIWDARHIRRRGGDQYGDAIRTGIAEARGRYILCMDADGSHNPASFRSLWAERECWDIVIGSRYAPGGQTENPAILIAMSYIVNLTFRVVFKLSARDVTNSFRMYRAEVLKPLRLGSDDFDILEEILIRCVTHDPPARVGEVPVTFERRKAGESKRKLVKFAFGYLSTLRKLRRFQQDALRERNEDKRRP
jgi:dolichol-phosphate mannosyltransferase